MTTRASSKRSLVLVRWRPGTRRFAVALACAGIVPCDWLAAQDRSPVPPAVPSGEWVTAVRSGEPRAWAATLQTLGHAWELPPGRLADIASLLHDSAYAVRMRAVLALNAAGPQAAATAPALARLLDERDLMLRVEAAFALGAVNGLRDPAVLQAVYRAAVRDSGPRIRNILNQSTEQLPAGLIPVSESFSHELLAGLASGNPAATRRWSARIAAFTTVPWLATEFPRLLKDPIPDIRYTAMRALAATQPGLPGLRTAIEALRSDSVSRIRDGVQDAISFLKIGAPQSLFGSAGMGCTHRGTPGATALRVAVADSSEAIHGDGRGPYLPGVDRVRVVRSYGLNLFLPWADDIDFPSASAGPAGAVRSRTITLDLSRPVVGSGARPLGVVRDSAAGIHVSWMWDPARRVIWNLDDIPVGAIVSSDRTQINLALGNRAYILTLGPWASGACKEVDAAGAELHGLGTTQVLIERRTADDFHVWAPPGSTARLWEVTDPRHPRDLGLYAFSFGLRWSAR